MSVYRCDWCGRFYSSELPEGSACPDHVYEHNERMRKAMDAFNAKLPPRQPVPSSPERP